MPIRTDTLQLTGLDLGRVHCIELTGDRLADLFVVNKADQPNADRTVKDLKQLQSLMTQHPKWLPPIITIMCIVY